MKLKIFTLFFRQQNNFSSFQKIKNSFIDTVLYFQIVSRKYFLKYFYLDKNFRADFNCSENTTELFNELEQIDRDYF